MLFSLNFLRASYVLLVVRNATFFGVHGTRSSLMTAIRSCLNGLVLVHANSTCLTVSAPFPQTQLGLCTNLKLCIFALKSGTGIYNGPFVEGVHIFEPDRGS